jgi:hypothetical protein
MFVPGAHRVTPGSGGSDGVGTGTFGLVDDFL